MKYILTLLTVCLLFGVSDAQRSKNATTSFTENKGSINYGDVYAVSISDTITDGENDTIVFDCKPELKKITLKVTSVEVSGTLSIATSVYSSPDGTVANIDYDNAIISALAASDGAWVDDVAIPVLAGIPSNIGPCAVVLVGTGTQSATYTAVYTEHSMQ